MGSLVLEGPIKLVPASLILAMAGINTYPRSLIIFFQAWNEFLLALVVLARNALRTATVGIALYPGEYSFPWDLITTATFLAIVPLFILTVLFQKQIISGLTAGSSK